MNAIVNLTRLFKSDKTDVPAKAHGGIHPPEHKSQSTQLPIGTLPLPEIITLPLRQHIGNMPKLTVKVGDKVQKGQLLAEAEGTVSAAIHASTSGEVIAIEEAVIPHPSGLPDHCVVIKPDNKDTWTPREATDWKNTPRQELIGLLRKSGIVGLGGATFPTQIKLRANGQTGIDTLVINAAECEPYITCDDMLMRERAEAIVKGIEIAQHLLDAREVLIGVEDNKPEATQAMQAAIAGKAMSLKVVPTIYPSGDARRLVYLLTGKEIPHNKRSTEVGIQVFNVGTVHALHRYFDHGEPVISRIVSMTGNVDNAQNFEVLLGTPLMHLANATGTQKADTSHYIMGGPMMGFNLPSEQVPITKAANCIIAASPTLFAPPPQAMPCIRCARCADACPVSLQPQELYWFAKSDNFEKARDYKLFDCIECGACSYVCPSDIPLVQYYRYAKSEIIADDKAKEAANIARERNEARLERIEREKQERAAKHAARAKGKEAADKKAEQAKASSPADDAKKAAIAAAIERAKANKVTPKNTEPTSAKVQKEIEAIDARREAAGLTEKKASGDKTVDAEKQAKIDAAIAKAKAAKAKAGGDTASKQTTANADPDKQAKIEAAIAKAKAAKAKAEQNKTGESKTPDADTDKQAKIQAAIAKAKAAKAKAEAAKSQDNTANNALSADAEKQAKIEAAIAKAKAAKALAEKAKKDN